MSLLDGAPRVVAVGAQMFSDALAAQAVPVTQVDWRPPLGDAGTEAHLARVLADPRHAPANATAVERLLSAGAELVDVRPGVGGAGPGPRRVPARRAADRLGPRRPARCAAR